MMLNMVLQYVIIVYNTLLIKIYLFRRRNEKQLYEDDHQIVWNISTISVRKSNRRVDVPLAYLWNMHGKLSVWEDVGNVTLEECLETIRSTSMHRQSVRNLLRYTSAQIVIHAHLSRICLFAYSIRNNLPLQPILIDEEYQIVDGYHRLVAYKIEEIDYIPTYIIS
jgi:hypothetical protein